MIVSENPNRPTSRWLQVCVLLCAVALLPLGVAFATAEVDRAAIAARMDTDGDGQISAEERQAYAEAERAAILKRIDTDGDGEISHEERRAAAEAERAAIAATMDTDGDGEISAEERAAAGRR